MNDSDMVGGLYVKPKHPNAPDFVIGKASINVAQFREWFGAYLKANPDKEWVNLDMKVSKSGKGYAVIDTWEPKQESTPVAQSVPASAGDDSDIPFDVYMRDSVI